MAAGFTAGMVASILATMDMAIPHTVTTVTDRAELVAWDRAALGKNQGPALGADFGSLILIPQLNPRAGLARIPRRGGNPSLRGIQWNLVRYP
jgi:hypothetical protein